jgi:hypothetical protein
MVSRKIKFKSRKWETTVVLLASLMDLSAEYRPKREVEEHIQKCGYLKLSSEYTRQAYDSKAEP